MARAMWKANLTIGSESVPVKLYAAVEDRDVHFRLLHAKDRTPVRQRMVDPGDGREVRSDEVRRGVELDKGVFVILKPEELRSAEPAPSRTIEVTQCVPQDSLDLSWYERPYWLGPDGSDEDYFALAEALSKDRRLGIARWVLRGKRYYGALEPHGGYLELVAMHSVNEVVSTDSIERPEGSPITKQEQKLAEQLISALDSKFDPHQLKDDYRERVQALVAAKSEGRRYTVREAPVPKGPSNLEEALRTSLRAVKGRGHAAA